MYNNKGVTIIELLIVALLFGVVALAVGTLYTSSQNIYFDAYERVVVSYELQYAFEHINKNVMQALGDKNSPAISAPTAQSLSVVINTNDPLTSSNYTNTVTYSYTKSGNELIFNNGTSSESLAPNIKLTDVNFTILDNKLLTVSLTGYYRDPNISVTFDSASYPRMASFQ